MTDIRRTTADDARAGDVAPPTDQDRTAAGGRPLLGLLLRLTVALGVVAVTGTGVWLLNTAASPEAGPVSAEIPRVPGADVPEADVTPGEVAPAGGGRGARPDPQAGANGADPLRAWADQLAGPTQTPARALMAYGNAELVLRDTDPACRLSWATLAGIGRIESNHGQYGGARLGEDGLPSIPIIGVPLDGSPGVAAIGDTDGGALDGDPEVDRAVGPMQFIPSTWSNWASDANRDGRGDPQQIDDAALAAGRYLCAGDRDLSTAGDWWAAVLSYNNSVSYAQKVFGLADAYARTAATHR